MGLSTVMASTVAIYLMLVVLGVFVGITLEALSLYSRALTAQSELAYSDSIDLTGLAYNTSDDTVWLNITNRGSKLIYPYSEVDVIVTYNSSGVPVHFYASFQGEYNGSTTPGWYVRGVYDATGVFHPYTNTSPAIWSPNTTLEAVIVLPSQPDNGTLVTVTLATPRGGREYVEFTWG